jgi:hypothetical protein
MTVMGRAGRNVKLIICIIKLYKIIKEQRLRHNRLHGVTHQDTIISKFINLLYNEC